MKDTIEAKSELLEAKSELIRLYKRDLLSCRGTLNCRGLLEHLLLQVHFEKGLKVNFNASNTCRILTESTRGTIEHLLHKAATKVLKEFKDGELSRASKGSVSEFYLHIYRKLSEEIHEKPNFTK